MELQEMRSKLVEWIEEMKHGYRDPKLYMWEFETDEGKEGIRVLLYTESNEYSIVAYPPKGSYRGYLGCIGGSRKPRAGESWSRGNDLADGTFCRKTWTKILSDIVGYELVKIHRPIRELYEVDKQ